MYWVISSKDFLVLATTQIREVAETIARTFGDEDCFVRWGDQYSARPIITIKEARGEVQ